MLSLKKSLKKCLTNGLKGCIICINTTMVDGTEYNKVLEITGKADHMGLIILAPYFKQSVIEPVTRGIDDLFQVRINEMRYPTIKNVIVHRGNFVSVEMFISGAFFLHESLCDLGIISEDVILSAAQQFILMETIRTSGE